MKIAVICANGKAGKLIVEEAARRGHEVTAVVRGENRSAAKSAIIKDLFDLTADDLKGFDSVVDAFGAWTPEALPQHVTSLRKICGVLSGSPARLYVVGGAGSLYLDAEHKTRLMDAPEFPAVFMGVAQATADAFYELRERSPSPDVLMKLSGIFHVSTDYLLGIEKKELLDVSGLTASQITAVLGIIAEYRKANNSAL